MVRYLCISGSSNGAQGGGIEQKVVRIPLAWLRAGLKLHNLIPERAADLAEALQGHEGDLKYLLGIADNLEIPTLSDSREKVRIYIE